MPAIVTNDMRVVNADLFTEYVDRTPTYVYVARTSNWEDETIPPSISDSTEVLLDATEELVGLKRILSTNVMSVVPRHDWKEGEVYDEYNDTVNLIDDVNPDTDDFYHFYVVTSEFNVYKCISNNGRSASNIMPTGTTINNFQTPDGYIWKYMYTIRTSDAFKFMTPNWIPCYTLDVNDDSSQWLVQQAAVNGTIDHVVLTSPGVNYSSSNPPIVTISGDGTGASAIAEVDPVDGFVSKIVVTDSGSGYTNASVTITDPSGVGATADPVISPIGGHGHNARQELGATYAMVRVPLEGDESGILSTDISYRRAGIITNPLSTDVGSILYVSDPSLYKVGETVTGQSSGASANIRSIDQQRKFLYIENISGQFTVDETVSSQTYNTTTVEQLIQDVNLPIVATVVAANDYVTYSGDLLYTSTRTKITRGNNQTEEVRFIVSF